MAFTLIDINLRILTFEQPLAENKHVVKLYELLNSIHLTLIQLPRCRYCEDACVMVSVVDEN